MHSCSSPHRAGCRSWTILGVAAGVFITGLLSPAFAEDVSEVQRLRKALEQMQADFDRQQQLQRQQIETLRKQIDALQSQREVASTPSSPPVATPTPPLALSGNSGWKPSDPIRLQSGRGLLDLSVSASLAVGGSTAGDIGGGTQLGGHDPRVNGFTLQNLELGFTGMVDPYFKATGELVYQIDSSGKSTFELEEAYAETLNLPSNLTLRVGQFFSSFGRHNPTHPHQWSFVDMPIANARFLGPDGLRSLGGQISWLLPTPFYSELSLGIQNSQGETAASFQFDNAGEPRYHRRLQARRLNRVADLLFTPRWAASFDLTDQQTLLFGASGAFGPNASGEDTVTQVYGADVFWKWKSSHQRAGFPFVSWQSEVLLRRYQAGSFDWDLDGDGLVNVDGSEPDANNDGIPDRLARETLTDYGFYSQLAYGFRPGWVVAFRGDYVDRRDVGQFEELYGNDPERAGRWRLSPNLTWYPSEFSRLRLQYNYDQRRHIGNDHSVWMQMDFSIGSHGAHHF